MGAPLLLSFDITNLTPYQLNTYANPMLVNISQDKDPATGAGTAITARARARASKPDCILRVHVSLLNAIIAFGHAFIIQCCC